MLIDLTHDLSENTPVHPGDPKLKITVAATFANDACLGHAISMGTHAGTHIDAPAHMLEQGRSLGEYGIDRFAGRGIYIKLIDKTFDLEVIQAAGIREGDIVLFHTGMDAEFENSVYFEDYPVMTEEIARYLVACKVSMVGVDTCSVDRNQPYVIHKILLENDMLIIENLANLAQLRGKEAMIIALPLKLNLDASPARVVAEVT